MCPQFVDFDGDSYTDIVTATYEGSPFLVRGSAAGWQQPEYFTNANGTPIRLDIYWDMEKNRWSNADGSAMDTYNPEGHLVSAAAFDWDDDGDFDLLVGSYGGRLYLHRNQGTNGETSFAGEKEDVLVDGEPFMLEGGLTAPRMVDWDGDGLTDIVTGGFKGGVYFYRNEGKAGAPRFAKATTLIAPTKLSADDVKVPTSGLYVDPVDYDNDGDLDLLVGGYAEWVPNKKPLTEEEQQRLADIQAEMESLQQKMQEVFEPYQKEVEEAANDEETQAIYARMLEDDAYLELQGKMGPLYEEMSTLQQFPEREAGVWLYRQK